VGFRDIVLRPALVGDVKWVQGDYHSPYGMVSSHWKKEGGVFDWMISVPANCKATVYLPVTDGSVVTEGGRSLAMLKEVKVLRMEEGRMVLAVGSGNYDFRVK